MFTFNKSHFLIFILYLTLLLGFYWGEDSIGGAYFDYQSLRHLNYKFIDDFFGTLINYDSLGHRQSPIQYIIFSKLSSSEILNRIIFLHFCLLAPIFFYKSLKIINKSTPKKYLKLISGTLILFPTFRSYSIWPDPHMFGTVFFLISIYYFLKFKYSTKLNFKYSLLNILFLSIAAYISPNFGVFSFYFFYEYFKKYKLNKEIIIIAFCNIILSLPFFYYLFFLDINFIFENKEWDIGYNFLSFTNFSNKFIIINSLIFFLLYSSNNFLF